MGYLPHRSGPRGERISSRRPYAGGRYPLVSGEADPRGRRLAGAGAAAATRGMGLRVPQQLLPRHRRYGRGRPCAAAGPAARRRRLPSRAGYRARGRMGRGHAKQRWRMGFVRQEQQSRVRDGNHVQRLRGSPGPVQRRRHRARARDVRKTGIQNALALGSGGVSVFAG